MTRNYYYLLTLGGDGGTSNRNLSRLTEPHDWSFEIFTVSAEAL